MTARAIILRLSRLIAGSTILLWAGCAGLKSPATPVPPPAHFTSPEPSASSGFHAVYEGHLRIWWHSFQAIWVVAIPPGGGELAVAILSPTGVTILRMHGTPDHIESRVGVPAAQRLQPYGEALWHGLWWALASGEPSPDIEWTQHGERMRGRTSRGHVRAEFHVHPGDAIPDRIRLRGPGRRRQVIHLTDPREESGGTHPGRLEIHTTRPRCRLTLALKTIRWNEHPKAPHDTSPF